MGWAAIAQPFGGGVQPDGHPDTILADESEGGVFYDDWKFSLCDDACTLHKQIVNTTVYQGAPGRVVRGRGIPLPIVTPAAGEAEAPFVIVTKFPQGQVLVTALGRTHTATGWTEPRSIVLVDLSSAEAGVGVNLTVGLLGRFHAVTLVLPATWPADTAPCALAADLASASPPTATEPIGTVWDGQQRRLTIAGTEIDRIGTSASNSGSPARNTAAPGLLLHLATQ